MLKEFKLDPEAITYIQECLSEGSTFSEHLLKLLLKGGQVTTYLPATVSPLVFQKFKVGGVTTKSKTRASLINIISTHLGKQGEKYVVFEALERLGDACLLQSKDQFFIHETEIYYFLASQDNDPVKINDAIRAARSYPFIGALISLEEPLSIQAESKITTEVLKKLAKGTECILIGAYDDEGVLIWSK